MLELPFITVCMPVRNEEQFIEETINMLISQDYKEERYEIIIADGNSDDNTVAIVKSLQKKHPQINLKNNPNQKSSSGRNIGFRYGKGDIFLVIDGHCFIPNNQLFKNIIRCFEKSGADCLGRPQPLNPPDISSFQKAVAKARASFIGHGGDSLIFSDFEGFVSPQSHGAVYTRRVIEKIGYVDETFDACEDVEFNFRVEKAGFKTYMSPDLTVMYYPRGNYRDLFRQMTRYGRGRINLLRKHSETFSVKVLVPLFFLIGLLLNFFSISMTLSVPGLLIFPYILYLILITVYALRYSDDRYGRLTIHYMMIYFCIHLGLGTGLFTGLADVLKSVIKKHVRNKTI